MFKKLVFQLSLILLLLCFGTTMFSMAATPITLVWSAGGVGGGWYTVAAGISELVKEMAPEISIKVVPGESGLNPLKVDANDAQLGLGLFPFDAMAMKGTGIYNTPVTNVKGIGGSLSNVFAHFLAYADYEANSMAEIIEKKLPVRIVTQPAGSSEEFILRKALEAYGVTYDDIKSWGGQIFFIGEGEGADLFKDKHADVLLANMAPPAAIIEEISVGGRDVKLLPISKEAVAKLTSEGFIGGERAVIKKENYNFLKEDLSTLVTGTEILVGASVPEEVVYKITKIICENPDRLLQIHASLKDWIPEEGWKYLFVPLHPGAERYYREAGYLK
ncbi:hypothetical protein CVT91_07465 [Candidatus Atribacteria bacterium HGW-Atribacteria-1]|nr:MAG: hypothetical protein CVT91_07465 [Candidatus Atribacteria bacterium HGW-Atribacteria-1]